MKNNLFIKEAEVNMKNDFSSTSLDAKIINEVFRAVPTLRTNTYKLELKHKDEDSGDAVGMFTVFLEDKKTKIVFPIFIQDFKMKPIDTFVTEDQVAFPLSDSSLNELLNNPENFRKLTKQEVKGSKLLSKLASDDFDSVYKSVQALHDSEKDPEWKQIYTAYLKGFENQESLFKTASSFSEPIMDYIIKRDNDFNFDLYYVKIADEKINFIHDKQDSKSVRLLLEATGYDSIKMADDLNSGEEIYLKSPISLPNDNIISIPFDPNAEKLAAEAYNDISQGPVQLIAQGGKKLEGHVFDLYDFTTMANNKPKSKLFVDYSTKAYLISTNIQGQSIESDNLLEADEAKPGSIGVFVDLNNSQAFGPVNISGVSKVGSEDENITVKFNNRKYSIKTDELVKKYIINDDDIIIPKSFKFISLDKKLTATEPVNKGVINKIASMAYRIHMRSEDNITLAKLAGEKLASMGDIVRIPSKQHMKLLVSRLNFITPTESVVKDIETGVPYTFSTSLPLRDMMNVNPVGDLNPVNGPDRKRSKDIYEKIDASLNKNYPKVKQIFPSIFKMASDEETVQRIDGPIKEGATIDTLDTIFSLNLVNDINSSIFLTNLEKLKFTLSYLAALRVYVRYGWNVGIKEGDVNAAIDGLSEIIRSIEIVKTKKILEKQL